jgi:hypothetical protein
LGVDPESRYAEYEGAPEASFFDEYQDMLDTAHRSEGRGLSVIKRTESTLRWPVHAKVEPAVYVRWAERSGYAIPPELQFLLESDEPKSTDLDVAPEFQASERADEPPSEREIEAGSEFRNGGENSEVPSAHVDRPVGTRERRTMLVIMEILARLAEVDTTKPYAAAETIRHAAETFGLTIDSKTIAKKLEEIPDALESRKQ